MPLYDAMGNPINDNKLYESEDARDPMSPRFLNDRVAEGVP